MAKKNSVQSMELLEIVRENSLAIIGRAEAAMEQIKPLGDDFVDVFQKSHKRHSALLHKIAKLVERDRKKSEKTGKERAKASEPKVEKSALPNSKLKSPSKDKSDKDQAPVEN